MTNIEKELYNFDESLDLEFVDEIVVKTSFDTKVVTYNSTDDCKVVKTVSSGSYLGNGVFVRKVSKITKLGDKLFITITARNMFGFTPKNDIGIQVFIPSSYCGKLKVIQKWGTTELDIKTMLPEVSLSTPLGKFKGTVNAGQLNVRSSVGSIELVDCNIQKLLCNMSAGSAMFFNASIKEVEMAISSGKLGFSGSCEKIVAHATTGQIKLNLKNSCELFAKTTTGKITAALPENLTNFSFAFERVTGKLINNYFDDLQTNISTNIQKFGGIRLPKMIFKVTTGKVEINKEK